MSTKQVRHLGEHVQLTCDCELGYEGENAAVTALDERYMTLEFANRIVHTGANYKYLRSADAAHGRWSRQGCYVLCDGIEAFEVSRVLDDHDNALLSPTMMDAIRAHICDVLNTIDVDALHAEWMRKP